MILFYKLIKFWKLFSGLFWGQSFGFTDAHSCCSEPFLRRSLLFVEFRFWADPASASPTRSGKGAASVSSTASAKRSPCAGSSRKWVHRSWLLPDYVSFMEELPSVGLHFHRAHFLRRLWLFIRLTVKNVNVLLVTCMSEGWVDLVIAGASLHFF